jgi:hypothetical protein
MTFGVYAAFRSGLLGVTVNGKSASSLGATGYWTLAFLTGFSERFGTHILQGAAGGFSGASAQQDPDTSEPAKDTPTTRTRAITEADTANTSSTTAVADDTANVTS